jgi:5-methylcytosine-specific restriction endonuclease McrA
MTIKSPVLVINASYEPISICPTRRAITLIIKGAASLQESHDRFVWGKMPWPSVIRLTKYRKVPRVKHDVTRRSIFARDQHTCQYCGIVLAATKLTIDHIIPKSRGGGDTWENLVSACKDCNHRKADRTPEEAGMVLIKKPLPVTIHTSRTMMRSMGDINPSWQKYLFY